ncbi:ABC-type transport system substrate-binding protein [Bradyrhizobium sp. LB7.2]
MSVGRTLFAATLAGMLALTMSPASSQTLRYANQGDLKSLDPYSLNESTTHAHLGHVYQGLTARDKDLKIIPALAESWETPGADPVALPFAKGRKIPQRRPLHRRRRAVLRRSCPKQKLEHADPPGA